MEARRTVKRQLQKSRQEMVLVGNRLGAEDEKQVDRQEGSCGARTEGICS